MTDPIRRPVSQVRAGDLIELDASGTVYVVCAISLPVGASRRAVLVDARTGEPGPSVRLSLRDAVPTHPGRAQWVVVRDEVDGVGSLLTGPRFQPAPGRARHEVWDVEIDLMGRPGWEQLRRGARQVTQACAA